MRCRSRLRASPVPIVALFAIGAVLSPTFAAAQTPPPGQPGAPPEAMEPPSENPVPPADPNMEETEPREPLSEQLKRGDGVLEPPRSVDPGITQPVPEDFESKTPVIPPPGEGEAGEPRDLNPK